MIRFENVTYRYPDGTAALEDLSFSVEKGERLAIIGNNGSGKTTLALLVNGILKATEGRVVVDGLDPSDENESKLPKRKVGLIFQNPDNQLISTTVERETAFSLENMNVPQSELRARVQKVIFQFGLSGFQNRLTSELSGGEKQKLALAAVMVVEPDILIFDEPGSYLDESGRRLLDEAMRCLFEENRDITVLRITQYACIAEQFDRVILLENGRILLDGSPESVYSQTELCLKTGVDVPLEYRIKTRVGFPRKKLLSDDKSNHAAGKKEIILDSVHFAYDKENPIFEGINLSLDNGGIYAIVGPSGSGKTTLIQLLAGLLKPEKGKIVCLGFSPEPGDLAVCFQQAERQFFLDTVDKELRFGAENVGVNDIDSLVDECYRLVGFSKEQFANRDPFTLSGGEKRRLAFGTILSLRPKFVFFDEPTCALDRMGIEQFSIMVDKLHHHGIGVVIVSHYGDVVFSLADSIIALDQGRIIIKKDKLTLEVDKPVSQADQQRLVEIFEEHLKEHKEDK